MGVVPKGAFDDKMAMGFYCVLILVGMTGCVFGYAR